MVIPDKKEYLKEIEKIDNDDLKSSLLELYDHLLGKIEIKDVNNKIKEALHLLFINEKKPLVPVSFFDTMLARVLFSIMYGIPKKYTVKDITELTGYRKQNIHKDIKNERLYGEMKNGEYIFTEEQVTNYLVSKGFGGKKCSVEECFNEHYAKGYCQKHYRKLKREGEI